MAITAPTKAHTKVHVKDRFVYLRLNLSAGRYREEYDSRSRRERFDTYRLLHGLSTHGHDCYVCPHTAEHWHHIVPVSRGGEDSALNLVPLCKGCHKRIHRHARNRNGERPAKPLPKKLAVFLPPEPGVVVANPSRVAEDHAQRQHREELSKDLKRRCREIAQKHPITKVKPPPNTRVWQSQTGEVTV